MKRRNHWNMEEKIDILRANGLNSITSSDTAKLLDGWTFEMLDSLKKALVLISRDADEHRKEFKEIEESLASEY